MADDAKGGAQKGIAALPPTTVRQIGSHQLLTDPGSVVKELIDNALDARAKSIFVDIAANSIDSIQVKDDGHGIPNEDRALACRRYCTSKIRDFRDLKEIGGKWLGFRGEALASVADMSGTICITTRVEGEPVAVKLTYQRNGELTTTERDSHPVGTTVKVTKLLETARVRRDFAIKGATKCIAKIRRLLQAYALARPAVRFSLHVLKAKNNRIDFMYAPKANASIEDAALKIFGKECALQCDWTALGLDGFEVHAFIPKPTAVGSKIANHGGFITVDSRPVSSTRGTLKKVAAAVKDRLRQTNPALANTKDLFFCLNIICPVDSYDPNIEPAKDDIMFGDESFILKMVARLLASYYPENSNDADLEEDPKDGAMTQSDQTPSVLESPSRPRTPFSIHEDVPVGGEEVPDSAAQSQPPRWRSSMYGIDEEDIALLQENVPAMSDEEDSRHDAAIYNPWIIARMNAPVKQKKKAGNGQLPSPAKSLSGKTTAPHSPVPTALPYQDRIAERMTPPSSLHADVVDKQLDYELQQSIQRLSGPVSIGSSLQTPRSGPRVQCALDLPSFKERMSPSFVQSAPQMPSSKASAGGLALLSRKPRAQKLFVNKPYAPPASEAEDVWFGQPMRNAPGATRPPKRPRKQTASFFPNEDTFSSQKSLVLPTAEHLTQTRLTLENNTDIRDFFGSSRRAPADATTSLQSRIPHPQQNGDQVLGYAEHGNTDPDSACRPRSADSYRRSEHTAQEMDAFFQLHQSSSPAPSSSPIRTSRPSHTTYMPATRSLPGRRGTPNDSLHRTKSSNLALNSIPHGFETHSLVLNMKTSVSLITQQARKLDLSANTLEWGYDSTPAFDTFRSPIGQGRITQWVIKVDDLLAEVFERRDVETRGALHEGIQRFLDVRRSGEERASGRAIVRISDVRGIIDRDDDQGPGAVGGSGGDLQDSRMQIVRAGDGFGDGVDDEMLMDL